MYCNHYLIIDLTPGAEKRSRSMVEEEREIVAYHESGHALIGWLLEHTDALLKVFFIDWSGICSLQCYQP